MTAAAHKEPDRQPALKLLRSPEIKRVLKAARDAGITIGSVDIRPDGITIYPPVKAQGQSAYDLWKSQNTD